MSETVSEYLARTAHLVDSDPYAGTDYAGKGYCPTCGQFVRISERSAFRGADKTRSTLACGHVITRPVMR